MIHPPFWGGLPSIHVSIMYPSCIHCDTRNTYRYNEYTRIDTPTSHRSPIHPPIHPPIHNEYQHDTQVAPCIHVSPSAPLHYGLFPALRCLRRVGFVARADWALGGALATALPGSSSRPSYSMSTVRRPRPARAAPSPRAARAAPRSCASSLFWPSWRIRWPSMATRRRAWMVWPPILFTHCSRIALVCSAEYGIHDVFIEYLDVLVVYWCGYMYSSNIHTCIPYAGLVSMPVFLVFRPYSLCAVLNTVFIMYS